MVIKKVLILFLIANIGLLEAQYTAIPDNNFEQILINQGIDSDGIINGQVLTSDINVITFLNLDGEYTMSVISDLTGIEDFTALEELNCRYNLLTELHLENNIALKILDCSINIELIALNLSQNINLEYLNCSYLGNNLSSITIDFSNNVKLEYLQADNSSFNNLDLANNINLKTLRCSNDTYDDFGLENNIINLNLSNNTKLEYLECYNTNLENILLPNTDTLTYINLGYQNLSTINVSYNTKLENLILPLNYNLSTLDIASNHNLKLLNVNKCNLTLLDVSQNLQLEQLHIGYLWRNNLLIEPNFNNNIQNIDISHNINLKSLNVRRINLNSLDITNNINLILLNTEKNNLSSLDLINNLQLKRLNINENPIQTLDLVNNTNLEFLSCELTSLNSLNLNNNNNDILNNVYARNNPNLNCIEVDNEMDANNNIGFYINWQKDATTIYSEDCTAINSIRDELKPNISLYPNPTEIILFINSQNNINIKYIKVFNMLGQQLIFKEGNISQLNFGNLKPALYLVKIKTETEIITTKILKK